MTAYNREKYIAEAIESVIASTYQNWELIIVDDQSIDRTVEIAHYDL
jgi:glycosyltransferase involved in cell wall biosynthesis